MKEHTTFATVGSALFLQTLITCSLSNIGDTDFWCGEAYCKSFGCLDGKGGFYYKVVIGPMIAYKVAVCSDSQLGPGSTDSASVNSEAKSDLSKWELDELNP
jgi:hypothetical protein